MSGERDFYRTLELQPGASLAEIDAAYHRLTELYHPDNDPSLDAEVKYKEIRIAYKTLLDRYISGEGDVKPVVSRDSSQNITQPSEKVGAKYHNDDRIPLKWENLFSIFSNSLEEISVEDDFIVKGFMALASLSMSCRSIVPKYASMQPYSTLIIFYYIISWLFFIFSRYYFTFSAWTAFMQIEGGILYGAILIFLISCFYTVQKFNLILSGFWAAVSIWALLTDWADIAKNRGRF